MAVPFIQMDKSIPESAEIINLFNRMTADLAQLAVAFDALKSKVDGSGADESHFTLATSKYGYPDNATAKRSYDQINSTLGNSEALKQAGAYHKQ